MDRYQATQLRTLMPGSERTFKCKLFRCNCIGGQRSHHPIPTVNWATGMPGAAPQWENEYSIFVGDLCREVTESELVVRVAFQNTTQSPSSSTYTL